MGDELQLKDTFKSDRYKICFRFFKGNCVDCIDEEMLIMKSQINKTREDSILIITDFEAEELEWFCRKHVGPFQIFRITDSTLKLGIPIEKYEIPYYFLCNKSLKPINVFPLYGKAKNQSNIFFNETPKVINNQLLFGLVENL